MLDGFAPCQAGCGRQTRYGTCSVCVRSDPETMRQRRRRDNLREIRAMAAQGLDTSATCLSCGHWSNRCLMDIPECGPSWAPKCSCFLPEAAVGHCDHSFV